jgi:cytochrome c biogenesis protein CcmG/thiol:disulfide interchange protein DsbE
MAMTDGNPSTDLSMAGGPGPLSSGVGRPPGRHTARWIAGIALVVLAALLVLLATRPPAAATEVYTPLLGKPAPALSGTTLSGSRFQLTADRGRWVVVNFFASWCPPCQEEEPDLVAFAFQHRAPGDPVLIGVVYDDTTAAARGFEKSAGATWPTVVDPGGQIALRYGVRGPPETFLISPAGIVVAHLDSSVTAADLDQQIVAARAAGL